MTAAPSYLDRSLVAHVRSRRAMVWAGVLTVVALGCAAFPLFGALGFEFAFVMALAGSFAAADMAVAYVRRTRELLAHPVERVSPAGRLVAALWARAALAGLALLVPPLLVISLNALRIRQCDWVHGGAFYALLPGLSVLCATSVGVMAALALARRPRLAVAAAWLFIVVSIGAGIWRFYAAPPIFGYDPFAGYFPGSLYDEDISLGAPFFWSRAYQAAFAVAALSVAAATLDPQDLALKRRLPAGRARSRGALVLGGAAALVTVVLTVQAADLGWRVSAADIAAALGGRRETAHFVIHYPRTAGFAAEIDAIAEDHEYRYAQVARAFGVEPAGKITSFYFAHAADKQRWMGAGATYIAKPWRREIYLQHDEFPHHTLRHEIAHVFAGEFGDPVFRVSVKWLGWPPARFNVGLIEGAAVAADWPSGQGGRMTPHQSAHAMLEQGRLPPLRLLLAPGFLQFSSAQSYTTAGSFLYFLLGRYGRDKFRAVYRAGGTPADFRAIYGVPLGVLEQEWHDEVETAPLSDQDRGVARERFRRGGIFQRPCPHAVARRAALAGRLVAAGEPDEAIEVLRQICRDDPGEPSHRLALAATLERAGKPEAALAGYEALGHDDRLSGPLRTRALMAAADLAARGGDLARASRLVDEALVHPTDEATRRNLGLRELAFDPGPGGVAALRAYLLARGPDNRDPDPALLVLKAVELAQARPDSGLGHYLVGRLLEQRDAHADAARALARAQALGLPDELVARENDRLLAVASFLAGDRALTRAAAARLAAPSQPLAVQAEGQDWLERCEFAEKGAVPVAADSATGR